MESWDYREADALLDGLKSRSDWKGWHQLRIQRGYEEGCKAYRAGAKREHCPKHRGPDGLKSSAAWLMAWDECYRVDHPAGPPSFGDARSHAELDAESGYYLARDA